MGLKVSDAMQASPRTVSPDASVVELERAFLEARVGAFPVVENGRLLGVVSRSDVVRQLACEQSYSEYLSEFYVDVSGFERPEPHESFEEVAARAGARVEGLHVRDLMSRGAITIDAEADLEEAARVMHERRIHRLPVLADDKLVGILSTLDLARLVAEKRLRAT